MLAGLGYGLAQIGAGLSGGLVRGQAYQDQKEREKKLFQMQEAQLGANLARMQEAQRRNKAVEEARERELGYKETELALKGNEDIRKDEEAKRKKISDEMKAKIDAITLTMNIFKETRDGKTARSKGEEIYRALAGKDADTSFIPDLTYDQKTKLIHITIPGQGTFIMPEKITTNVGQAMAQKSGEALKAGKPLTMQQQAELIPGAVFVPEGKKKMGEGEEARLKEIERHNRAVEGFRGREVTTKEAKADQEKIDTEDKALARLTAIAEKRTRMAESLAKLKGSGVSEEMYKVFPKLLDFGFLLGQKLSPEEISKVEKVHAEQLKTLAEEEARLRAKHLKGGTAPAPAPKAEEKRRPEVSAVATEMKTKKQKAGQYKVEGYLGYWDGKEFKYTE